MIRVQCKKKFFADLIILLIFLIFNAITVSAEDDEKGIGFQIQPVFNSNQIENDIGYYYVSATPGEKQDIDLIVTNTSEKKIKLSISIENAISSNYGNLAYSSDVNKLDSSLKDPLTKIVIPNEPSLVLEPKKSEKIKMKINVPSEPFKGVKMGRVVVKEKKQEKNNKEVGPVTNEYEYSVGIILTEEVASFNDGKSLKLNKIEPRVKNAMRVISAEVSAPSPKTIEGLKVRSYVTEKGNKHKIKERNVDNFMFAPNSKTFFDIPWGTTNFKPGEYTFHFKASNKTNNFYLKKNFEISGNRANNLNEETAFSVITSKKNKITLILINILLVTLIVYILLRDRRWVKQLKTIKKRKKNKKHTKKRRK